MIRDKVVEVRSQRDLLPGVVMFFVASFAPSLCVADKGGLADVVQHCTPTRAHFVMGRL